MSNVKISKYNLFEALFKAQDEEEDIILVNELNDMINIFCTAEKTQVRNIEELDFDREQNYSAINYIATI